MPVFFRSRTFLIIGAALLIGAVVLAAFLLTHKNGTDLVTTTVERGDVLSIISVSGVVESEEAADLAFPISDIVATVSVDEGDHVERNDALVTLERGALLADRNDALGSLAIARADRDELIAGPTNEARSVTESSVSIATDNLLRVEREQDELVENARRALFSDDLEAVPNRANDDSTPPTISGAYTCEESTTYTFTIYRASTGSGYAYRISGASTERETAYTQAARPFGECGLLIQFDPDTLYDHYSRWTVEVPNTRSASYTANLNAYELALQQRENKVAQASQELELALNEQELENANPRDEALARANARVLQAEARLAVIDANIEDRILRAPFAGTVTDVTVLPGETSGTVPVVTLVADNTFELTVRIPEIDITKITVGDGARVIFDARTADVIDSRIDFISPLGTEIDGVAYYEGHLEFDTPPTWLRSGLNADVDIVIDGAYGVLRLPSRFLKTERGTTYAYIVVGESVRQVEVEVGFVGNDGFVEVFGLNENTVVTTPPQEE